MTSTVRIPSLGSEEPEHEDGRAFPVGGSALTGFGFWNQDDYKQVQEHEQEVRQKPPLGFSQAWMPRPSAAAKTRRQRKKVTDSCGPTD